MARQPLTEAQKERKREREREWYAANPEKVKASNQRKLAANPNFLRDKYANNRKARIAASTKYAKLHVEQTRAQSRASYHRRKAAGKQVRSPDKESARVRAQNRRGRAKLDGEPISKAFLQGTMKAQRYRCAGCARDIRKSYHTDHITPLARGGKHERKNIQLLCPPCNLHKHAKDPIQWRQAAGLLL